MFKSHQLQSESQLGNDAIAQVPPEDVNPPPYTHYLSVLRFIPLKYHDAIRRGTCTADLTAYVQAALDWIQTKSMAVVNGKLVKDTYFAVLWFPAGVYPLRSLCWSGRVGLIGDGPGATFLVYAPPTTSAYLEGCEAVITTDWRKVGAIQFPTLAHAGLSDLAIVGFPGGALRDSQGRWRMAKHLLLMRAGIDVRFRCDRVWVGLCRSDALVFVGGVTNAHVVDLDAVGVGGYVISLGCAALPKDLVPCLCCDRALPPRDSGPAEFNRAPAPVPGAPPTAGAAAVRSAAATSFGNAAAPQGVAPRPTIPGFGPLSWVLDPATNPSQNEVPLTLERITWRSGLPATMLADLRTTGVLGDDRLETLFGAGVLHIFNGNGMCVALDDLDFDAATLLFDPMTVVLVEVAEGGGETAVAVRDVRGHCHPEQRPLLLGTRLSAEDTTELLDIDDPFPEARPSVPIIVRAARVDGAGAVARQRGGELEALVRGFDPTMFREMQAWLAYSDCMGARAGASHSGYTTQRSSGVSLGPARLRSIATGWRNSVSGQLERWQQGDLLFALLHGYPATSVVTWPELGIDAGPGQLVTNPTQATTVEKCLSSAQTLDGASASVANGAGRFQIGSVSTAPSNSWWLTVMPIAGATAGKAQRFSVVGPTGKRRMNRVVVGDSVCLVSTTPGVHAHRVVSAMDSIDGVIELDVPIAMLEGPKRPYFMAVRSANRFIRPVLPTAPTEKAP